MPAASRVRSAGSAVGTATLFALMLLSWSGNYPFARVGLEGATPLWLAAMRAGVGAIVVGTFLLGTGKARSLSGRDRRDALLLGLPNTAAFLALWFVAAQVVAPGEAAVVIYTFPLWVALFSVPVLGRRLGAAHWGAVAAGFSGVVLVSEPWAASTLGVPVVPFAELLAAAVSWAGATVLFQRRYRPEQLATANGFQLVGGALTLLVLAVAVDATTLPSPSVSLGVSVLWLGGFGTAFAYIVWFGLLGREQAATLSAYTFLVPLGALGLGAVFLGETVDAIQAAGIALVLLGVYGIARAGRRRLPPDAYGGLRKPRP